MTENTYHAPPFPRFLLAVILTPLAIGLLGAPLALIPTFAAIMGAPAYLILGVPLAWLYLRAARPRTVEVLLLGFIANLGTFPLYFIAMILAGEAVREAQDFALFPATFGIVFAPIFAWVLISIARTLTPDPTNQ